MRFLFLMMFFSCSYWPFISAQQAKVFKINPGEKIAEKVPFSEIYYYPEFTEGKVYFRNNSFSSAPLNYNSLFSEMQFINANGDTLSLDNEGTISVIVIKTDSFYFSEGYQRLIYDKGRVKLAKKTSFAFTNREKLIGYGEASSGNIETYSKISNRGQLKDLVAQEVITIVKKDELYIGDRFGNFKIANKKNVLSVYANKEREFQDYCKTNKTDFLNETDIKNLMNYFANLKPNNVTN